jgi:hypothetical protein
MIRTDRVGRMFRHRQTQRNFRSSILAERESRFAWRMVVCLEMKVLVVERIKWDAEGFSGAFEFMKKI